MKFHNISKFLNILNGRRTNGKEKKKKIIKTCNHFVHGKINDPLFGIDEYSPHGIPNQQS